MGKQWRWPGLLFWASLSTVVWAQPPTVVQTAPGEVYQISVCAGLGDEVWLGGTVQSPSDASGQPTWTDGFLTRLGPDGRSLWRKRFGGEGGEGVRALAPLPGGGAVVAGYASTDLALAWAGQPKPDWAREAFLARVGDEGQLLGSLDLRSGPGDVMESYVLLNSVACRPDGCIWVAGRFEGSLWGLVSHGPQAFVALLTPDFRLLKAYALDGYEVSHGTAQADGCLAAGIRKTAGAQQEVVLWKLEASGAVAQAWVGRPSETAACLQLEPDHLVFGEGEHSWELEFEGWQRRPLPEGVRATATWKGARLALEGDRDAILWRQGPSGWQPTWRLGSGWADCFRFLVTSPAQLTLAGYSRVQQGASWIRLFRLPSGNDLADIEGASSPRRKP